MPRKISAASPGGDDQQPEPMTDATLSQPVLDSLTPDAASIHDGKLIVALRGSGFTMHSTVYYDDQPQPTGILAPDLLSSPLDPALWFKTSTVQVTVKTGDHVTAALPFTLTGQTEEKPDDQQDSEQENQP